MDDNGPGSAAPGRRGRAPATPAQRALALLVRREHSRRELLGKLTARGIPEADAQAAVRKMTSEGWQDDARFAVSLARMRVSGGHGPIRIRAELEHHGIGGDAIAAAMAALDEAGDADWSARARELVERRYGGAVSQDLALQRKAADFLQRRGFDGDTIRAATRGDRQR